MAPWTCTEYRLKRKRRSGSDATVAGVIRFEQLPCLAGPASPQENGRCAEWIGRSPLPVLVSGAWWKAVSRPPPAIPRFSTNQEYRSEDQYQPTELLYGADGQKCPLRDLRVLFPDPWAL